MKLIHLIPLLLATACFAANEPDKVPGAADAVGTASVTVEEKAALANFKTEIESTTKWIEDKQKTDGADPVKGIAMIGEIVAKFKDIKTEGLPADLKTAWSEMTGVITEFGDLFKGLPKINPEKPDEAMKSFGEIMPKMMALQTKGEPIAKKLEEVGKKYGLDLKKVGPGGGK